MAEAVSITPAPPRAIAGIEFFGGAMRAAAALGRSLASAGTNGVDAISQSRAGAEAVLAEALGLAIPAGASFTRRTDTLLFRLAPSRFFAIAPDGSDLPRQLETALSGLAAVTDQSDAWAIFTISGPGLAHVLSKIIPVDMRPAQFPPGTIVLSRDGHIDIRVWKLDERSAELACIRSVAEDMAHRLEAASR